MFGNPCRVCLGKLPMPVLRMYTADLFVHHCCHCVSGNWENVTCQQWYFCPCQCWFDFISPLPTSFTRINQKSFMKSFHYTAVLISAPHSPQQKFKELGRLTSCSLFPPTHSTLISTTKIITSLFMASIHIANFCHLFHHTSSWSDPVPYWPAELGADRKHAVGAATELRRSMGRFSATSVLG